jgi:hypothetical protein
MAPNLEGRRVNSRPDDVVRARMVRALNAYMTEDQLLTAVVEAAQLNGWRWHHVRRSDRAIQQGYGGFPDLVLAKDGRILFLELKTARGVLAPGQSDWLDELRPLDMPSEPITARVVRPADLDDVIRWLGGASSDPADQAGTLANHLSERELLRAHGAATPYDHCPRCGAVLGVVAS